MAAYVKQSGINVTSVQPGTPVEYYCNDLGLLSFATEFQVKNTDTGQIVLDQYVGIELMRDAWLDTKSPVTSGNYVFIGDTGHPENQSIYFTVSSSAPPPNKQKPATSRNWLLIGSGIVAAIGALIAVLVLVPRKGGK